MKSSLVIFILCLTSSCGAQKPKLWVQSTSQQCHSIITVTGDTLCIEPDNQIKIKQTYVSSINNDNSSFYVVCILDKKSDPYPVLQVGDQYFRINGYGSSTTEKGDTLHEMSFLVNAAQADNIADAFRVPCYKRKHPGLAYKVEFIPLRDDYRVGDSVYVKYKITNTGSKSFQMNHGGMYRNSNGRCDYFDFDVYYNGILLPDEGPTFNFGGIESHPELAPGAVDSLTECITKWSHFTKPGKYTIQCSYGLHFEIGKINLPFPENLKEVNKRWDDKATKTIEIIIRE